MSKLSRAEQARINGAKSNGPKSPESKARSRRNLRQFRHPSAMTHTEAMEYLEALEMVTRRLRPADPFEAFYCERIALVRMLLARHGRNHNAALWQEVYFQKRREVDFTNPKVRGEFDALLARAVHTLSSHEPFLAALGAEESRLLAAQHNLLKELVFLRQNFPFAEPEAEPITEPVAGPKAEPAAEPIAGPAPEPNPLRLAPAA
jgi:hypothetical protein